MSKNDSFINKRTRRLSVSGLIVLIIVIVCFFSGCSDDELRLNPKNFHEWAFKQLMGHEELKEYLSVFEQQLKSNIEIEILTFIIDEERRGSNRIDSATSIFSESVPSLNLRDFFSKNNRNWSEAIKHTDVKKKLKDWKYKSFFIAKASWITKGIYSDKNDIEIYTADLIALLEFSVHKGEPTKEYRMNFSGKKLDLLAQSYRQFGKIMSLFERSRDFPVKGFRYYPIDLKAGYYREARKLEEFFDSKSGSLINKIIRYVTLMPKQKGKNADYPGCAYSLTFDNKPFTIPWIFKLSSPESAWMCLISMRVGEDGSPKDDNQTIVAVDLKKDRLDRRDILQFKSIDFTPELANQVLTGNQKITDNPFGLILLILFIVLVVQGLYILLGIIFRIKMIFFSSKG
ncbi:MAG: hypothetical protein KAT34_08245 [Candidatus Aminicenantes bacterium]|nr:hypothetical protein [Candidatus Aminicenantes bacterium]